MLTAVGALLASTAAGSRAQDGKRKDFSDAHMHVGTSGTGRHRSSRHGGKPAEVTAAAAAAAGRKISL
jgi:hypothetical protein